MATATHTAEELRRPGAFAEHQPASVVMYGAFKGLGDLLAASPAIRWELDAGSTVVLLIFPHQVLRDFVALIDFGERRENLRIIETPENRLRSGARFFAQLREVQPDLVWISPHAPRSASSWRAPLGLWLAKRLFWPRARLSGLNSERLSFLFDEQVPLERSLPLAVREWAGFHSAAGRTAPSHPPAARFIQRVSSARHEIPLYDLLIHPGANTENRRWPLENYARLLDLVPESYRVAVLGLPEDVKAMQAALPWDRGITFISGTVEAALFAIARSRVVLAMDSGATHFANALGVPTVAIFGCVDPMHVLASDTTVLPVYEQQFECQPCGRPYCVREEVFCMTVVKPEQVATRILKLLSKTK